MDIINRAARFKKSTALIYVNAIIFFPFLILAFSGLLLQHNYHLEHMADTVSVLGLNRSGWLLLHKITAVLSAAGVSLHVSLHINWLKAVFLKKLYKKPNRNIQITLWLLILAAATILTGIYPWLFAPTAQIRHNFIEIHDKIGILLAILFILHKINHWRWFTHTFSHIRGKPLI